MENITRPKTLTLTLIIMSVSIATSAFAATDSQHGAVCQSFAVLENGSYKDPSNGYDLAQAIVQDNVGNIYLMDGANTDSPSVPVIYGPEETCGEFANVQKGVINSDTINQCASPSAQTQNPELCDPAYYDSSGALLIKQGDAWETKQTIKVLSNSSYLLGPIINAWYRNNQPIVDLDLATNLNGASIVFVKE